MKKIKIFSKHSGSLNLFLLKFKTVLFDIGKNAFLFILILVLLEVIFGQYLFYKYVYLAGKSQPEISSEFLKFNENEYQSVLDEMKYREGVFNGSNEKSYANPFQ